MSDGEGNSQRGGNRREFANEDAPQLPRTARSRSIRPK
jgi:hypothetical protein